MTLQMSLAVDLTRIENGESPRTALLVAGEIDLDTAPRLYRRIRSLLTRTDCLLVDLTEVGFVDSSGVGVLVSVYRAAQQAHQDLTILLPVGRARFAFEVTGLVSVLENSSKQQVG